MGTYNLDADEIADSFEIADVESCCIGDFYEEEFVLGAIEYIRRLRKKGASIYTEKRKEINKFVKELQK